VSLSGATFRRVTYRLLNADPVPIWYIEEGHKPDLTDEPIMALYRDLQRVNGRRWIAFRGVPIDRLRSVFFNGVDVDPTDGPIFCGDEEKAFEYARPKSGVNGPGLMYALHRGYLERTFQLLPADASPEKIAEVRKTYPHEYDDPHGGLYFSRLADQNNTAYEYAYGYWIPGSARDALLAIFLRGRMDEVMEALRAVA
jgi:hypothetical protein